MKLISGSKGFWTEHSTVANITSHNGAIMMTEQAAFIEPQRSWKRAGSKIFWAIIAVLLFVAFPLRQHFCGTGLHQPAVGAL